MGYHENPPYYLTAYDLAVKWGFRGSEQDWLNSLTAFAMAQEAGYAGSAAEWIAALIDPVPELQMGEVTTLDGGAMATASFSGDKRNPVLNLGIPRGLGMSDALPLLGGRMRGSIDMAGNRITGVPIPALDGHAVPKQYVDDRLKKDGSEAMTGDLDMGSHYVKNLPDPVDESHAVPKRYVDKCLKKDGSDAMEGELDMDGHRIINVASPTKDMHAVNRAFLRDYVSLKYLYAEVTLTADGWSTAAPYTQTIALEKIKDTDHPHWALILSDDAALREEEKDSYALVDALDTAAGSITFTCFEEKPEVDLNIQLEVNR